MSKIRTIIDNINDETTIESLTTELVAAAEEVETMENRIAELENEQTELNTRIDELKESNYDLMKKALNRVQNNDAKIIDETEKIISFDDVMDSYED